MVHLPSEPFFCRQIRAARPVPVAKVEKQHLSHLFSWAIRCLCCGNVKCVKGNEQKCIFTYDPIVVILYHKVRTLSGESLP